nr:MinD/ParA family protein [Nocardia bovistercoris]
MPTGEVAQHGPDAPIYADPDAAAGYPPVPPSGGRHRLSAPEQSPATGRTPESGYGSPGSQPGQGIPSLPPQGYGTDQTSAQGSRYGAPTAGSSGPHFAPGAAATSGQGHPSGAPAAGADSSAGRATVPGPGHRPPTADNADPHPTADPATKRYDAQTTGPAAQGSRYATPTTGDAGTDSGQRPRYGAQTDSSGPHSISGDPTAAPGARYGTPTIGNVGTDPAAAQSRYGAQTADQHPTSGTALAQGSHYGAPATDSSGPHSISGGGRVTEPGYGAPGTGDSGPHGAPGLDPAAARSPNHGETGGEVPEAPGGYDPAGPQRWNAGAYAPPGATHRAPVSDQLAPGERRDPGVFAQQPRNPEQGGFVPQQPAPAPDAPPAPDAAAQQWNSGQPSAITAGGPGGMSQPGAGWGAPPGPQGGPQPSLDDVPMRRAKKSPGSGWRKAVHHVSGGAINPGMSAEERRLQELVARIRQPVRGDYRIAVLSLKGGVGKTTTTMGLGSIFASVRGDRVIAVDANPDFGTLSQRVPLQTRSTVRDLLLDPQIDRYSDVRRHTSQATSRLEVLASERDPAASESFNDEEYRSVARILQRFYNIILTDCGTGLMHSAMTGVLDLAHSLVLISSAAIDGARSAAATLDWLSLHGHDHLVRNAVVVINLPREGSPNVGIQQLREYFLSRCRAVHIIPYDSHLSEGAEIDLHRLSKQAKRAYVELAATVADEFSLDHRRYHN